MFHTVDVWNGTCFEKWPLIRELVLSNGHVELLVLNKQQELEYMYW